MLEVKLISKFQWIYSSGIHTPEEISTWDL